MRDCSSKAAMASSWVRDATWCLFSLLDDKHHDHVGVLIISAAVSYKFRSSGLREELPERRSRSPRRGDAFLSARGGGDDDIPEDPAWDCSGTHPPVQLCSRSHELQSSTGSLSIARFVTSAFGFFPDGLFVRHRFYQAGSEK